MQMNMARSLSGIEARGDDQATSERSNAIARLCGIVVPFLEKVATERARRRAIAELGQLDDYMLRDIGVQRGDIEQAVRTGRPPQGKFGRR